MIKSKSFRDKQKDVLLDKFKVMDLNLLNSILEPYEDSYKGLNDLIFDLEDIGEDIGDDKNDKE